ncbi:MAG: GAF domain-containing protein [Anaerolineales bacterium]|nr:GAF domain-containing protein [Anaerolineales bacterium]
MWRLLKTLLVPPLYDDYEQDRRSRLGTYILVFLLVFTPAAAVINYVLARSRDQTWQIGVSLFLVSLLISRWLMQKRQLHAALVIMLVTLWGMLNWSAYAYAGGVSSAVFTGNLVVVVLAGLLLGRPGATVSAALTILAGLVLAAIEQAGLLPLDLATRSGWSEWVTNVTYLLCVATALFFFVDTYEHVLHRWRMNESQLRESNEQLRINSARLRAQNEVLATLQQTTVDLLNRRELSDVLSAILDRALFLCQARNGFIYLLEADNLMHLRVPRGVFAADYSEVFSKGVGLTGKIWAQGEPLLVTNYDEWAGRDERIATGQFGAILGVPLSSGQEVVGVLVVTHDRGGATFSNEDLQLLTNFAEMASIALDNVRLLNAAEEELAVRIRAEARNEALLRAIPDLIMQVDRQGNYLDVRGQEQGVLPLASLGQSLLTELPPALRRKVEGAMDRALSTHNMQQFVCQWPQTERHYEVRVIALGEAELLFIWRDISEQLQTERALREKHKMESLGMLAGGIAHDFNNMLTSILSQASLVANQLPADDKLQKNVGRMVTSAERASDLTRQLLAYAGKADVKPELIDLNKLVRDNVSMLESMNIGKATIELNLRQKLPPVQAARGQLQQLVMNLVINAAEALPESGGIVRIATSLEMGPFALPETQLIGGVGLPAGPYICLEVRDTGRGMSPDTVERIFDPFFTTKETGHGLGLSATLGIVSSFGGGIAVSSTPAIGSLFRVYLPAQLDGNVDNIPEPEINNQPAPEDAS